MDIFVIFFFGGGATVLIAYIFALVWAEARNKTHIERMKELDNERLRYIKQGGTPQGQQPDSGKPT